MADNVNLREVNQVNSLNLPAGTSMSVILYCTVLFKSIKIETIFSIFD